MSQVRAVAEWAEAPLERFVKESGSRLSLLTTPSGQVVAQYGFARSVDVMTAAALGAGVVSSTSLIGQMMGETGAVKLNNQGQRQGIFLAEFETERDRFLIFAVYDSDSSAGLVQLFFEELVEDVKAACPTTEKKKVVLAAEFERELNDNLAALFGRK